MGGVLGMGLPIGVLLLIGLLDSRYRYSDETDDAGGSGLALLGILPNLPDRLSDPAQASMCSRPRRPQPRDQPAEREQEQRWPKRDTGAAHEMREHGTGECGASRRIIGADIERYGWPNRKADIGDAGDPDQRQQRPGPQQATPPWRHCTAAVRAARSRNAPKRRVSWMISRCTTLPPTTRHWWR